MFAPIFLRDNPIGFLSFVFQALIVPSGDAHNSEWVALCDERRSWLTGFSGSAGTALVTRSGECLLWTDGRYFHQAARQLQDSPFRLMRQHEPGVPELPAWCLANLGASAKVGVAASLATLQFAADFTAKSGLELVPLAGENLVDVVWSRRRPRVPREPVVSHALALSGETVALKVGRVAEKLRAGGCAALCVSALDQIAWLCNLRGSDIECNPVFLAYAVLRCDKKEERLTLFLRALDSFPPSNGLEQHERGEQLLATRCVLQEHFLSEGCVCDTVSEGRTGVVVALAPYETFTAEACARACGGAGSVMLEQQSATLAMAAAIAPERRKAVDVSFSKRPKASPTRYGGLSLSLSLSMCPRV